MGRQQELAGIAGLKKILCPKDLNMILKYERKNDKEIEQRGHGHMELSFLIAIILFGFDVIYNS